MTDDLRRENAELRATIDRLRAYVEDQARLGIRADCNPTVRFGMEVGEAITWFYDYLRRIDQAARDEARRVLDAAPATPAVVSRVDVCPECGNPWSGGHFPHCTIGHRLNPSYWQIETVEELDALPDRTVILDADSDPWRKARKTGKWSSFGSEYRCGPHVVPLPARVLWLPPDTEGAGS